MTDINELRIMARVALMYYQWDMSQTKIARQLGISQPTISRYLERSREEGIVRISIDFPKDVYTELEESLIMKYKLRDAVVVDCMDQDKRSIQRDLGSAAAYYLESILRPNEIIGISALSRTILALVDTLHTVTSKPGIKVVQILGGMGNPADEMHANRLVSRVAKLLNGEAIYLPVTGIVATEAARNILLSDDYVKHVTQLFDKVTTCLVGVGGVEPNPLLEEIGDISSYIDLLKEKNAVGDIHYRFYDINGNLIETGLEKRVIAMDLQQLKKVERSLCVGGGNKNMPASWVHFAVIGLISLSQTALQQNS
jgi:DNA-binding transcriptional regulator LsrR (DeoR family)